MDSVDSFDNDAGSYEEEEESRVVNHSGSKKSNILLLWGNERTMNLNALILTNIQSSHYFKVNLYELKTYHEVIDEIYFKVNHLEPWEKGSRKTAGQTGMCGGVRGVGAGGIVSTAYCLLYKLFTLKLTRKQVNGLITHPDSPYIRALGFMYIRYTQPPADLWDWYDAYLEDDEEMDVKAGGGQVMTIGNILKNFLCKLEWFSTLFPRIPVPIQQKLEKMMNERFPPPAVGVGVNVGAVRKPVPPTTSLRHIPDSEAHFGEAEKMSRMRSSGPAPRSEERTYSREREVVKREDREKVKDIDRERDRSSYRERDRIDYSKDRGRRDKGRERDRESRDRRKRESPSRRYDEHDDRVRRDSPRRYDEHDDRHRRDRQKHHHHHRNKH